MRASEIKVGHWYETSKGYGQVKSIHNSRPKRWEVLITGPVPRGKCFLQAREFLNETSDPATWPKHDQSEGKTP